MSGGQCLEANSLINSTASSRWAAEHKARIATSAVAASGVTPAACIEFRVWWIAERSELELELELGLAQEWERRMWKVERSGEKEGRVLVMWWRNLTESVVEVAILA